jgi:hypothetical protein
MLRPDSGTAERGYILLTVKKQLERFVQRQRVAFQME